MWKLEPTDEYQRRHKRYEKKHSRELAAVLDNLDTVMKALKDGLKLEQVRTFGFAHAEPHGVLALDQKGGHGTGLAQTRLYVYLDQHDPKAPVMHVITLGDKGSQSDDIRYCSEFVLSLRESQSDEPEKTLR